MTATIDNLDVELVELGEREGDGLRVTLLWHRTSGHTSVLVSDERTGSSFSIDVGETDDALDVFRHPFAHAAFRGLLDGDDTAYETEPTFASSI